MRLGTPRTWVRSDPFGKSDEYDVYHSGCRSEQMKEAEKKRLGDLEAALREMVYETTHLSPCEDDGSHKCKISAATLAKARAALT